MAIADVAEKPAKKLAQDEWEFGMMLRHVSGAGSVLEIGSRYGESLRRMAVWTQKKSRLIGVDLGVDPFSPPGHDIITPLNQSIADLCASGHDARLVIGDSHAKTVIDHVQTLGPFDFLFIDGDHSFDGVYRDWNTYGPMARIVAFHDINYGKPGHDGAKTLWGQIKHSYCHATYIRSGLGIGIIFREEPMR